MKLVAMIAMGLTMGACGGSSFSALADNDAGEASASDADRPDSGGTESAASDAGGEAEATIACTCGPSSCFYSSSEPAPGYGAPLAVSTVTLSPAHPSSTWTETIWATPAPFYSMLWSDLNVSAFAGGGTLTISGHLGSGCTGSTVLVDQCVQFPKMAPISILENASNVAPGATWAFDGYAFQPGTTVLHLGSQCSFGADAGASNDNTITVQVQP